jgi:polyribonucleotide nucleotidyltransferase
MIIREKVRIGDQLVTLETGRIAKQAGGSCLVRAGETIVLVTVCGNQDPKPNQSFFPMSVDYQEKTYSAGKIPGGFFKREGKLRDYEVLVSRLIDRPCRPLFPEGYMSEVQIVATVMSFDQQNPPDTLAMIGASAALHISQIPWKGPIAGVRIGRVDGKFIANPTFEQIEKSDCELLLAASREAIVMVEGEADEISEEDLIEAMLFGHRAVQDTLDLIDRMQQAVGKTKWRFNENKTPPVLGDRIRQVAEYKVREACSIADKHTRSDRFKEIRKETVAAMAPEFPAQDDAIKAAYEELRYNTMRAQVLDEGRRLDGRDTRTVRPISIELGVLPRVHGSSLFTRGETQAIVTTTLGTARDSQRLDTLSGDVHKHFMLHYNFPPYSVGEVKPMRGPGRREVGHGNLAERALAKMMPTKEEFPYAIRIVSEITESNGSSSMASVCGGSLALMDAGVPVKAPVAGVAMGLIKEGDDYAILTDILGDEDALGDMDFKVCGTEKGVTAIQMDIKVDGLSREILERALHQAREARLHILDKMQRSIAAPREELSAYAPRITSIRVKPDQIRTIIGPGGKMIRAIVDQTGANIDVEDDGTVNVSSADSAAVLKALEIIKSLTTDPEIGEVYDGTVKRIEPYGAFIEILPGKDGLCHISDLDFSHVSSVEEYLNLGDKVKVKVTNIDREGRIRLSRKDALEGGAEAGAKLNGRAEGRDARPARDEQRPSRDERPPQRAREFDRDEQRPKRTFDRDERPARGRDEERPAFKRDFERDERPAPKRDFERDERPAKPRDAEREERPAPRGRDFERDERPAKPREEERAAKPRDDERAVKPRDDERAAKPRDDERAAKPRDDERAAKPRDAERPAFKRDFERDERAPRREEGRDRPSFKPRDAERDARPAPRERDEELRTPPRARDDEARAPRARDEGRDLAARSPRPRDEERPALRSDERSARPRPRDEEPRAARPRDDEARPVRARDDEARPVRARDDEARPVRARDDEARPVRGRDEGRELARPRGREDEPRSPRVRDEEVAVARGRDEERPARGRDDSRDLARPRGRDDERAPRVRDEEPRAARPRDEEPRAARVRDEEPRAARVRDEEPRAARPREEPRELARPRGEERDTPRARPRELETEERARPRVRDEEPRAARPRDDEPRAARPRDDARPARSRDEEPRAARPRDDEPRTPRAREERPLRDDLAPRRRDANGDDRGERPPAAARPRSDSREDRFEPRSAARAVEARGPAREQNEERPRTRPDSEPPARPPVRSVPRFEDDSIVEEDRSASGRERGDRTERERPSRTRERARNRERVREADRERR